jgi:hypothetical protein
MLNHLLRSLSLLATRRLKSARRHNRRWRLRPVLAEFPARPAVKRMLGGRVSRRQALHLTLRGSLEMGRLSVATAADHEARHSP